MSARVHDSYRPRNPSAMGVRAGLKHYAGRIVTDPVGRWSVLLFLILDVRGAILSPSWVQRSYPDLSIYWTIALLPVASLMLLVLIDLVYVSLAGETDGDECEVKR